MKKIKQINLLVIVIVILCIFFPIKNVYAEDNSKIIEEQQEEFGINSFLDEVDKYKGEFFKDIDINQMLEEAITGKVDNTSILEKILSLLGSEVVTGIKAVLSILAVIVIHSVLKAISDNLENNNIGKLIYFSCYCNT